MHLAENEIAQYVGALVLDRQDQLPEEILEHVEECYECKVEIMEVMEFIEAIGRLSGISFVHSFKDFGDLLTSRTILSGRL